MLQMKLEMGERMLGRLKIKSSSLNFAQAEGYARRAHDHRPCLPTVTTRRKLVCMDTTIGLQSRMTGVKRSLLFTRLV